MDKKVYILESGARARYEKGFIFYLGYCDCKDCIFYLVYYEALEKISILLL